MKNYHNKNKNTAFENIFWQEKRRCFFGAEDFGNVPDIAPAVDGFFGGRFRKKGEPADAQESQPAKSSEPEAPATEDPTQEQKKAIEKIKERLLKLKEVAGIKEVVFDQEIIKKLKEFDDEIGSELNNVQFENLNGAGLVAQRLEAFGIHRGNLHNFLRNVFMGFWGLRKDVDIKTIAQAVGNLPENNILAQIQADYTDNTYPDKFQEDLKALADAIGKLTWSATAIPIKTKGVVEVLKDATEKKQEIADAEAEKALLVLCDIDGDGDLSSGFGTDRYETDQGDKLKVNILGDTGIDEKSLYEQARQVCLDREGHFDPKKFKLLIEKAFKRGQEYAKGAQGFVEKYKGTIKDLKKERKTATPERQAEIDKQILFIKGKGRIFEKDLKHLSDYRNYAHGLGSDVDTIQLTESGVKFGRRKEKDLQAGNGVADGQYSFGYIMLGFKALYEDRSGFNMTDAGAMADSAQRGNTVPLSENWELRRGLGESSDLPFSPAEIAMAARQGKLTEFLAEKKKDATREQKEKIEAIEAIINDIQKLVEEKKGTFPYEVQSQVIWHFLVNAFRNDTSYVDQKGVKAGSTSEWGIIVGAGRVFKLDDKLSLIVGAAADITDGSFGLTGALRYQVVENDKVKVSLSGFAGSFGAGVGVDAYVPFNDKRKEWGARASLGLTTSGVVGSVAVERDPVRTMWNRVVENLEKLKITAAFDGKTLDIRNVPDNITPTEVNERLRMAIEQASPGFFSAVGVGFFNGFVFPFLSFSFGVERWHAKGFEKDLYKKQGQLMDQLAMLELMSKKETVGQITTRETKAQIIQTNQGQFQLDLLEDSGEQTKGEKFTWEQAKKRYEQAFAPFGWKVEYKKQGKDYFLSVTPKADPTMDTEIIMAMGMEERAHYYNPDTKELLFAMDLKDPSSIPVVRSGLLFTHTATSKRIVIIGDSKTKFTSEAMKAYIEKSPEKMILNKRNKRDDKGKRVETENMEIQSFYGRNSDGFSLDDKGQQYQAAWAKPAEGFTTEELKDAFIDYTGKEKPKKPKKGIDLTGDERSDAEFVGFEIYPTYDSNVPLKTNEDLKKIKQKHPRTYAIFSYVWGVPGAKKRDEVEKMILEWAKTHRRDSGPIIVSKDKEFLFTQAVINQMLALNASKEAFIGEKGQERLNIPHISGMVDVYSKRLQEKSATAENQAEKEGYIALSASASVYLNGLLRKYSDGEQGKTKTEIPKPGYLESYSHVEMLTRGGDIQGGRITGFDVSRGELVGHFEEVNDKAQLVKDYLAAHKPNVSSMLKGVFNNQNIDVIIKAFQEGKSAEFTINGVKYAINFNLFAGFSYNDPVDTGLNFECFNPFLAHNITVTTFESAGKKTELLPAFLQTATMNGQLQRSKDVITVTTAMGFKTDEVNVVRSNRVQAPKPDAVSGSTGGGGSEGRLDDQDGAGTVGLPDADLSQFGQ